MTSLAPTMQSFFTARLGTQQNASPNTVAAYRDTFRLLLRFVKDTTGVTPNKLTIDDIDAITIARFLDHLESDRGVSIKTRNSRLAAIHSFFHYAAMQHPEHGALIQRILAIPTKRSLRPLISYLTTTEIDALLATPDITTVIGRRDRALLTVAVRTGLRVSELTALRRQDAVFGTGAHITCTGKGRKQRSTPLAVGSAKVLHDWINETHGQPHDPIFPGPTNRPLTRDAVAKIVARHGATAAQSCPTIKHKKISPHVLRHSCAMQLLDAGVDVAVIALWLGHESIRTTDIYQHADIALKERALARVAHTPLTRARFKPSDPLLAFLETL